MAYYNYETIPILINPIYGGIMGVLFQWALKEIGYEFTSSLNTDKIHEISDQHHNCDVYIGEINNFDDTKVLFYHNGVEINEQSYQFTDPMIRVYFGTNLIYESHRVSSKIYLHVNDMVPE